MKYIVMLAMILVLSSFIRQQDTRTTNFPRLIEKVVKLPGKERVWIFMLAGQSNMAGRGLVEPQDTISNKRIITINAAGELVYAKEPLHFYEPALAGLDAGLSFGKSLLKSIPRNITILLIPTAIGGSSMQQWIGDSMYRKVKLLSNFKEKVMMAKNHGTIKAVLWHQGESDANSRSIPLYESRLSQLFTTFREIIQNPSLPIVVGELGVYSNNKEQWSAINKLIHQHALDDTFMSVVSTSDLVHKGDTVHFNSEGQRKLGERYAKAFLAMQKR